jgi:FtsP/CotA-like multicopper oxidase with cupredoxin domain
MIAREKDAGDMQDVVMMLHDFTFRSPVEVLAGLGGGSIHGAIGAGSQSSTGQQDHAAMRHGGASGDTTSGTMGSGATDSGMDHVPMAQDGAMMNGGTMLHANDVAYDAYLANDRTLDDPEIVRVDKGGRVRLRVINGATATAFFIDTGVVDATCIAVDGSPCQPHSARRFPIAQGQRLDLVFGIPKEGGAFPVVAQVEASHARTGIVLATVSGKVTKVAGFAPKAAGHTDLSLDEQLRSARPLASKPADKIFHLMLGEEPGYRWTIDGRVHGDHRALEANLGDRVELVFNNPTSMMHPMHLHGHHFQVVATRGARFSGPMRDTVIVPPRSPVTVAVDLDKPGRWFLHCHHLYHMANGMMTEINVT